MTACIGYTRSSVSRKPRDSWLSVLLDRRGDVAGKYRKVHLPRDNGLYIVPAVYSGNSLIIDPTGRILASSNGGGGVFWCEIDLAQREAFPWVGHWRSIGARHRMPHTYGLLQQSG